MGGPDIGKPVHGSLGKVPEVSRCGQFPCLQRWSTTTSGFADSRLLSTNVMGIFGLLSIAFAPQGCFQVYEDARRSRSFLGRGG